MVINWHLKLIDVGIKLYVYKATRIEKSNLQVVKLGHFTHKPKWGWTEIMNVWNVTPKRWIQTTKSYLELYLEKVNPEYKIFYSVFKAKLEAKWRCLVWKWYTLSVNKHRNTLNEINLEAALCRRYTNHSLFEQLPSLCSRKLTFRAAKLWQFPETKMSKAITTATDRWTSSSKSMHSEIISDAFDELKNVKLFAAVLWCNKLQPLSYSVKPALTGIGGEKVMNSSVFLVHESLAMCTYR